MKGFWIAVIVFLVISVLGAAGFCIYKKRKNSRYSVGTGFAKKVIAWFYIIIYLGMFLNKNYLKDRLFNFYLF